MNAGSDPTYSKARTASIYGKNNLDESTGGGEDDLSESRVAVEFEVSLWNDGTGVSPAMLRRASAATMPPIECPHRITCTDGSTVGEGVRFATSRSITLF